MRCERQGKTITITVTPLNVMFKVNDSNSIVLDRALFEDMVKDYTRDVLNA